MKINQPLAWLALVAVGLFTPIVTAEETAVVADSRINVRGQASLFGEVITQLQKGEKVIVLEEITLAKPKPDEPAKWFRIQMPYNTPVWVFASFIDPTNKTVTIPRINLRAGPGENYSVVGRLEKGDSVKDIRGLDGWMEIETPSKAYAFVAAELLTKQSTNSSAPLLEKSVVTPVVRKVEPPVSVPGTKANELQPTPPEPPLPAQADVIQALPVQPTAAITNVTINPAPTIDSTPQIPETAPLKSESNLQTRPSTPLTIETPPKRIVRREGIVRSTKSIQAPTNFEMISPETRKVINYLHAEDVGLSLKDFKGKKIIVTGEESIDSRWPKTPLIEIETLELAP